MEGLEMVTQLATTVSRQLGEVMLPVKGPTTEHDLTDLRKEHR